MHIEPDAEVVQGYPRRQSRSQARQFVGPLLPKAEGVEQLLVDGLYDLADAGYPAPKSLRPHLAGVAFGRADDPCSVVLEPLPVVFRAFEAFVDHLRPRGRRSHALEPRIVIRSSPKGEEGFGQRLVLGGSGGEAEAGDYPGGVDGDEQTETLVPSQAITPADVGTTSEPPMPPALAVSDRHRLKLSRAS